MRTKFGSKQASQSVTTLGREADYLFVVVVIVCIITLVYLAFIAPDESESNQPNFEIGQTGIHTTCDHGNRIYWGSDRSEVVVVPRDPACTDSGG